MIAKFSEAFALLARHFGLFTAIILTVWLPGNILVNYVTYHVEGASEMGVFKLASFIEGIFGPIYIGAIVYALFELKSGRTVTYAEAMAVGFRNWGSLFAARFMVGLLTMLGILAFVIPGMIAAVRFSLVDAAVIIDGKGTSDALGRSAQLTAGRRWEIFGSAALFFLVFLPLSTAVYLPLQFVDSFDTMPIEIALDCVMDLIYAIIQTVIFLFYWEATEDERPADSSGSPPDEFGSQLPLPVPSGPDDNPYRSPTSG